MDDRITPEVGDLLDVLAFVRHERPSVVLVNALEALLATMPEEEKNATMTIYRVREKRAAALGAEAPRQADQIRAFTAKAYVAPARERGDQELIVAVRDVHRRMHLVQRYPAIRSALQGRQFATMAGVRLLEKIGNAESSCTSLRFEILPQKEGYADKSDIHR